MHRQRVFTSAIIVAAFALSLGVASPAKAFYLEVPQALKDVVAWFKTSTVNANEGDQVGTPPIPPSVSSEPSPARPNDAGTPGTNPPQDFDRMGSGTNMPPQEKFGPPPGSEQREQFSPPVGPGQPGGDQSRRDEMMKDNRMNDQIGRMEDGNRDRGPEHRPDVDQIKQGARQMDQQMRNFDFMMKRGEEKGKPFSDNVKQKFENVREGVDTLKRTNNSDDVKNFNMDEFEKSVDDVNRAGQEKAEQEQRTSRNRSEMSRVEKQVSQFEKQIAKLQKSGVPISADIAGVVAKIKAAVAASKAAADDDALDSALGDVRDSMMSLQEYEQTLQQLSRWPQTIKHVDQQLKSFSRDFTRSKTIVDKLARKQIDVSGLLASLGEQINKLKTGRDGAVAQLASGNVEEAYSILEDEFFDNTEDVKQAISVIKSLGSLTNFKTNFNRGVRDGDRKVAALKRKKVATVDAERLLAETKQKGQEVLVMLASGRIDEDRLAGLFLDLENLKEEFDDAVGGTSEEDEVLPWQNNSVNDISVPKLSNQFKLTPQRQDEFIEQ